MKLLKVTTLICMSIFVTACAQQEEPEVVEVQPEPVFDKFGNQIN